MPRVCMGGTFDTLHRGHRALLDTAFEAGDDGVVIGITTDAFANAHRSRTVRPYEQRANAVERYARASGFGERVRVRAIDTPEGFALEAAFTAIVATEETAHNAERINAKRATLGLTPLEIVLAPYVLADDGRPIKATRIAEREVDEEGRILRAVRVVVGSDNQVKVEAARRVVERVFARRVEELKREAPACEVRGFPVESGVPPQPWREQTWVGALTRAQAARAKWPEADFAVGIEAGLFHGPGPGGVFDIQCCVVIDAGERATYGLGPGFAYPAGVADELRDGATVGEVLSDLSEVEDIGRKMGAVGWLTRGLLDRSGLTEQAVLMAFLPRLRPEVYGL